MFRDHNSEEDVDKKDRVVVDQSCETSQSVQSVYRDPTGRLIFSFVRIQPGDRAIAPLDSFQCSCFWKIQRQAHLVGSSCLQFSGGNYLFVKLKESNRSFCFTAKTSVHHFGLCDTGYVLLSLGSKLVRV